MTEKDFTDHAAAFRGLALKHCRAYVGVDDAEDIAQDTMLRLWALRAELPPADKVAGLVVTMARQKAIDHLRRQHTVPVSALPQAPKEDRLQEAPDRQLEDDENERWLKRHMQRLPSTEYMVLHLRQVEQKSTEEIAAILGITGDSVRVALSRARRKLFTQLQKQQKR